MKKETMYHYWNAKTKKYMGISESISYDVSEGGQYVHQAFEIEVPECPSPLTDAEKLENLVELSSLYFEQKEDDTSLTDFLETQEETKALIKEYSK